MHLGKYFKIIRKNRTYSQAALTNRIMSQSAYSKFEAGTRDVDATIYLELLHRLNISSEEFNYVRNDYKYEGKNELIYILFSLDYNKMDSLQRLKQQTIDFLEKQYDEDIKKVNLICEAFIQLHNTKSMEAAQSIVEPIWHDMSKYEQWYLNDIRIINTILFLFPVDTAIEFTQTILVRLDTYKDFRDAAKLRIAFKINLSLLLIKNKEYANAYKIIVDSLEYDQRKMNYLTLALHFSREAICRSNLQMPESERLLEKARQLLMLYNDYDYWQRIQQEFQYYTSPEP